MIEPITQGQMAHDYRGWQEKPQRWTPLSHQIAAFAHDRQISYEEIIGPSRTRDIAWARQDCMRYLKDVLDLSLPRIGGLLKRDHTTVLHGIRRSRERAENEHRI